MNEFFPEGYVAPIALPCEHGLLHGQLTLLPDSIGIVVLAHATQTLDEREEVLAGYLRAAGMSTLSVDLISRQEEHFADVASNVPLLGKRLLDFLALIKNRMVLGSLPRQPFGICAANATSPVAVRVAALRDHDIAALVCRGGLIDRAGMLYLRSLESPLLMLVEDGDAHYLASSRRALQEVPCRKELRVVPEIGIDYKVSEGFEVSAQASAQWFSAHLKQTAPAS